MKIRDLRGQQFGRLRVLTLDGVRGRHAYWRCRCDCGRRHTVRSSKLTAGRIVSCGCQRADPAIRQGARWTVPAAKRHAIARQAARARWK